MIHFFISMSSTLFIFFIKNLYFNTHRQSSRCIIHHFFFSLYAQLSTTYDCVAITVISTSCSPKHEEMFGAVKRSCKLVVLLEGTLVSSVWYVVEAAV